MWAGRFAGGEQCTFFQRGERQRELPEPGDRLWWQARAYDREARAVCEPCNEGWMSDLETAVSRLLDPDALEGRPLSRDEQTLLATWAMKTALTLNAASPANRRAIHPETARRFGHDRQLPDSAYIWLASYKGDANPVPRYAGYGVELYGGQDSERGWRDVSVSTFVVGPFVFQVFVLAPALDPMQLGSISDARIAQVWPIEQPVRWRREPSFDGPGVSQYAREILIARSNLIVVYRQDQPPAIYVPKRSA